MNNAQPKIDPKVIEFIKPIILNTTRLYVKMKDQDSRPFTRYRNSETDAEKQAKKECLHMIFNQEGKIEYILDTCESKPGYGVCAVCHKLVPYNFDENNENTMLDSIDVLNQLAFFAIILGLDINALKTIISMKATMPDVVQLVHEMNTYVRLTNSNNDAMNNGIGSLYGDPTKITNCY